MNFIVITTINQLTEAIEKFSRINDWHVVLVGDKKTPYIKSTDKITFLSVEDQEKLGYSFIKHVPHNHYCRKNIGYLFSIKKGANIIYESDDDNIPYDNWMVPSSFSRSVKSTDDVINICRLYTEEFIWPRGLPLHLITKKQDIKISDSFVEPTVIQTLADKDPDVDAIYRLTNNKNVIFKPGIDLVIEKGNFVPFNSQSTFWKKEAFISMYLPMFVSWRLTDILRSYVTQKFLWNNGMYLGYSSPVVYQNRNAHNYMKDFIDEIDVYTKIDSIIESIKLDSNGLVDIYKNIQKIGVINEKEVTALKCWISEVERI